MSMEKYCFSCMKKIPLMAHRCPYCREDGKETEIYIRIIFLAILIVALVFGYKHCYKESVLTNVRSEVKTKKNIKKELSKLLKEIDM